MIRPAAPISVEVPKIVPSTAAIEGRNTEPMTPMTPTISRIQNTSLDLFTGPRSGFGGVNGSP